MNTSGKLSDVLWRIDRANAADPNLVDEQGQQQPAELVYGARMSAMLSQFRPDAPEILQIAARGQHMERWTSPRKSYPEGRVGYLRWRKDLKDFHARRVGELMAEAGYSEADIARAGELVRKEQLKYDEEVQTLEDVICLVFLTHYAPDFIAPHDDEKVIGILAKTARKMSPEGLAAAGKLPLSGRLAQLLEQALAS